MGMRPRNLCFPDAEGPVLPEGNNHFLHVFLGKEVMVCGGVFDHGTPEEDGPVTWEALASPGKIPVLRRAGYLSPTHGTYADTRVVGLLAQNKRPHPGRSRQGEAALRPHSGAEAPYWSWVRLLGRVFDLDMASCPFCRRGALHLICAITQEEVTTRILRHLKLASVPPPISPARLCQEIFAFDEADAGVGL